MQKLTRKRVVMIVVGVLILAAIVYGFLPTAREVQIAEVTRAPLTVTIEDEGETNVVDRYQITAPVAAHARSMPVEAGDMIVAGQVVVELEAPRSGIPDTQTRAEMEARVEAGRAAVTQAAEQVRSAEATARQAADERARIERLVAEEAATPQALERIRLEEDQARAALAAARASAVSARADLDAARAALDESTAGVMSLPVESRLVAPAAGRVLAVHRPSGGPVSPGEPVIEIGDTERLEVRADVLSQDAVRIQPGMRVLIDQWGGEEVLEGIVERVEPQAFTRVSSLGVEERRVPVIVSLSSPVGEWLDLGANYRVMARFVVWEGEAVLQVPAGAVFRTDDGPAVFVRHGGRAVLRYITVGRQAGLRMEVVSGLDTGDVVIIHPDSALEDGDRVR